MMEHGWRSPLFFLLFAGISWIPVTWAAELPPLLKEVEQKYTKAATLEAEFSQVNESAALGKKTTTSGMILIKRPNKVRWETRKPESDTSLLVSDGRKFWFYIPPFDESEQGQLTERKSSQVQSRLAQALLSGSFSSAKDMGIKQETPSRFLLTPKKGSAGTVKRVRIEIDPEKKLVTHVALEHEGGNRSEIILSKIELGKPYPDELFVFVAPPNTARLKE